MSDVEELNRHRDGCTQCKRATAFKDFCVVGYRLVLAVKREQKRKGK